jgi:2-polyprenyl-3-methyl-5-hydroxy-6-metoxy-1,4-benzoquinol methylase
MNKPSFNTAYVGQRPDIERLVPLSAKTILDVGCSVGTLGASLKQRNQATVYGIELSPEMSAEAQTRMDRVFTGDAAAWLTAPEVSAQQYDAIVFADILEHLTDPWTALSNAAKLLAPGGCVVTSIPNIRHIDTLWNLVVRGRWPYRNRGIHDQTHLRFFTLANIQDLVAGAGLRIDSLEPNYRILERPHGINRFARRLAIPPLNRFLAFQYVLRATRAPGI